MNIKRELKKYIEEIKNKNNSTVSGLNSLGKAIFSATLETPTIYLTSTEQTALKIKNDLNNLFSIEAQILTAQDISLYDGISPNFHAYQEQVNVLTKKSKFIICPIKAILEKFPTKDFFENNAIKLNKNNEINVQELATKLVEYGYKRKSIVEDIGEFAIRGDIIDIFPLTKNPIRIELWGDTITDLRLFDINNQRAFKKIDNFIIYPLHKFILDEEKINNLKLHIENSKSSAELKKVYLEKIEEENYFQGIDYFQSIINTNLVSFFDYIDKNYTIILDESSELFSKYELFDNNLCENYAQITQNEINIPLNTLNHIRLSDFKKKIHEYKIIKLNNFIETDDTNLSEFASNHVPIFSADIDGLTIFLTEKRNNNYKIFIATDYPKRVKEVLQQAQLPYSEKEEEQSDITIINSLSLGGVELQEIKLLILTDKELFNKKITTITRKKRTSIRENFDYINSLNDIREGDFVVHTIHGIGIYRGLSKQELDGEIKDYLNIEYAQKDMLYMPAEQINQLCRYRGSKAQAPRVSRMGGVDWENVKAKVKKGVEEIAFDLVHLYAKRKISKGFNFLPDSAWQFELEDSFEFIETPDQMRAIEETKADMEASKPMDRLICGDVGFGKTEVALRAIFKAVLSSKQVALIVPTTILALQHFQNISERFKPYPVKVKLLSRFQKTKEQKQILKELENGEIDVIIGTHRLIQDDVKFKNIGLLVIDEEHRFGVRHKEKLKSVKENIDVLTMSATPIPRTLYMSLSGIKDMSLINTAPQNRLPIKTHVGEYSDELLKNAINYELNREGQIFILYNKVETIEFFAQKVRSLIPNCSVAVGHAKMEDKALEQVMVDFLNHEYDILICTTIIESGLDIKNANTMIIYDADHFGLAQLYQIRGRVGRSDKQAYCYCFYKPNKLLTNEARARLEAIKEFTTLGSGYQIAMKDIEIRGVGNLLGTKQHGNMINVGFDAYCQILEECIQELQDEKPQEKVLPTTIDINITAFIPDEWVGGKEQKLQEYKKLSDVTTYDELDAIKAEWKDRFSKLPQEVENLISLIKLRISATLCKIGAIRETSEYIRIYTPYKEFEWKILSKKISSNILRKIKYTNAPNSCKEGNSVLLFKHQFMTFEEIFSTLNELFFQINNAKNEYLKENN